jgi:hypothetical protein
MVGPGQTEDLIQPIESDRISTTLSTGIVYPMDLTVLRNNFANNPNTRAYQPRAVRRTTTTFRSACISTRRRCSARLRAACRRLSRMSAARGRNLFLRSVTNQIIKVQTNGGSAAPSSRVRHRDVQRRRYDRRRSAAVREIDYKTSGGHDQYNAMQLSVNRRSERGLSMNAQYTLGKSTGNTAGRTKR